MPNFSEKVNHIANALSRMHGVQKDSETAPLVFKTEPNGDITNAYAKQGSDAQTRNTVHDVACKIASTVTVKFEKSEALFIMYEQKRKINKGTGKRYKIGPYIRLYKVRYTGRVAS